MSEARTAIVVLGAPLGPNDELTEILRERVEVAAALYRAMVSSGSSGVGSSSGSSESPGASASVSSASSVSVSSSTSSGALASVSSASSASVRTAGRPIVVATGGTTRGARRAEADVIAEALATRGVPDVLVENRSRTTDENARMTAALLAPFSVRDVWIVTQPFHGRRAVWLFREAGFDARWAPMPDSVQYRDRWRAFKWTARECAAWGKLFAQRARGRLARRPVG